MPYYVFAVHGFCMLDKLAEFGSFRQASQHAKALRAQQQHVQAPAPTEPRPHIKLMFGETQLAAEDALLRVREAGAAGDE